jgi:ATP-dependent 26S proteasome regulatory subunit
VSFLKSINCASMSVERDIRFELISRLCPNSTGAELRSVCTEAGMFAIRYTQHDSGTNLIERDESWRPRKIS